MEIQLSSNRNKLKSISFNCLPQWDSAGVGAGVGAAIADAVAVAAGVGAAGIAAIFTAPILPLTISHPSHPPRHLPRLLARLLIHPCQARAHRDRPKPHPPLLALELLLEHTAKKRLELHVDDADAAKFVEAVDLADVAALGNGRDAEVSIFQLEGLAVGGGGRGGGRRRGAAEPLSDRFGRRDHGDCLLLVVNLSDCE
jgi:hypothetical protein